MKVYVLHFGAYSDRYIDSVHATLEGAKAAGAEGMKVADSSVEWKDSDTYSYGTARGTRWGNSCDIEIHEVEE